MSGPRSLRAIGVLGNFGTRNLGNEASLTAIIQQLRRRWPEANVYALSGRPDDTTTRYGIPAFANERSAAMLVDQPPQTVSENKQASFRTKAFKRIRRLLRPLAFARDACQEAAFLWKSFRVLSGTDLLIVGGGGVLTDHFGGPSSFPLFLLRWAVLARLRGARVAFVSVGAGPLRSWLGRLFIRCSLALADFHSYRDQYSKGLGERVGGRGEHLVFPDVAWSLDARPTPPTSAASRERPVVGINVFPHHDPRYWRGAEPARYDAYLTTLADFVVRLLDRGYTVSLFPTQLRGDARVIDDLLRLLEGRIPSAQAERLLRPSLFSVDDLLTYLRTLDLVVASRFHAVLLSHLVGTPAFALVNQPKTQNLMTDLSLSEYALPLDGLDVNVLMTRFNAFESNREGVRAHVRERAQQYREALDTQFDQILGTAQAESSSALPSTFQGPRLRSDRLIPPERKGR